MDIEQILRQIGSIHIQEITHAKSLGYAYVYANGGALGYGDTAWSAVEDSGRGAKEITENSDYKFQGDLKYFVSQCYDENKEEAGLLFKF